MQHYYGEPHPYFDMDVAVIGGKNSAAIAALELWRHGARVTLVHRGAAMHKHVKYWILPDIENRIKNGEIKAFFDTRVKEIREDSLLLATPEANAKSKMILSLRLPGIAQTSNFCMVWVWIFPGQISARSATRRH